MCNRLARLFEHACSRGTLAKISSVHISVKRWVGALLRQVQAWTNEDSRRSGECNHVVLGYLSDFPDLSVEVLVADNDIIEGDAH